VRRAALTRLVLGAALVAGLLISRKLFLSERLYPLTPVVDGLPAIPPPLDVVVLGALVGVIAIAAVVPRPRAWIIASLGLALVLAITDQSRWQPWFYQYLVMLAAFALPLRERGTTSALDICRVVVSGTYVWSGVQKLNPVFAADVFPWFVQPVLAVVPSTVRDIVSAAWIVVPLVEIGIGLALLVRPLRDVAVMAAVVVHAGILGLLGPLGHAENAVIWPWNVAMAVLVVLLFWREAAPAWPRPADVRTRVACAVAAVLFWLLPSLSFVGMWDAYLSGALYSGNVAQGIVAITPRLRARLPAEVDRHVIVNRAGTNVLTVWDWSMGELYVPPYPERRVYLNVARTLCRYGEAPDDLKLVVVERPVLLAGRGGLRAYDCVGERASP
jgi:hypothetical protein